MIHISHLETTSGPLSKLPKKKKNSSNNNFFDSKTIEVSFEKLKSTLVNIGIEIKHYRNGSAPDLSAIIITISYQRLRVMPYLYNVKPNENTKIRHLYT